MFLLYLFFIISFNPGDLDAWEQSKPEGTSPVPPPPLGWVFDGNLVVWGAL